MFRNRKQGMSVPKGPAAASQANPSVNPVPLPSSPRPQSASPMEDTGNMSAYQLLERRRQRKRRKHIIQASVAAAALVAALGGYAAYAHFSNVAEDVVPYDVAFAYVGPFETSVSASGSTQPGSQVQVTPEIDGIIEEVYVSEGDAVNKGDVLFTLKNDDLDKAVVEAEQAVKTAQNGVASAELNLKNARDERVAAEQRSYDTDTASDEYSGYGYDPSMQGLGGGDADGSSYEAAAEGAYDDGGYDESDGYDEGAYDAGEPDGSDGEEYSDEYYEAMSGLGGGNTPDSNPGGYSGTAQQSAQSKAIEAAQIAVDAAQIELDNANIALNSAIEARDNAKATAAKRTVTAPQSGTVVALNATAGAAVGAAVGGSGQAASGSLATIADLSTLRVTVQVNEVDINKLKVGQKALVTFSALPDVALSAEVKHIAAVASGSGEGGYDMGGGGIVTYAVEVEIPDPDPQVKPGMTASVKIITESVDDAIIVPLSAVQMWSDTEGSVFVIVEQGETYEDDVVEERPVTVVAKDSTTAVIEGDVADGDLLQVPLMDYSAEDEWAEF